MEWWWGCNTCICCTSGVKAGEKLHAALAGEVVTVVWLSMCITKPQDVGPDGLRIGVVCVWFDVLLNHECMPTSHPRLLHVVKELVGTAVKVVKRPLRRLAGRGGPRVQAAQWVGVALAQLGEHDVHVLQQVGARNQLIAALNAADVPSKAPFGDDVDGLSHAHVVHVDVRV